MKISLNWVFDHIKGQLAQVDITRLVDLFIKTTAEIEGWKKVSLPLDRLTVAEVIEVVDRVIVRSAEHNKEYELPLRPDGIVGSYYMVFDDGNNSHWATSVDCGGVKEMLLPALDVAQELRAGGWKSAVECEDYIVDVDNKSINSRPDLWGHRGLAREIAAMLDMQLRPLEEFIVSQKSLIEHESAVDNTDVMPFSITIENSNLCKRFAAGYLDAVVAKPSQLNIVIRLSRLDSRSIDCLVDATNYVMLDLGQPMHAFDAQTLENKQIFVRSAKNKEKLLLLDGQSIELTPDDLVIADGGSAVSLAGIMGGSTTGITINTHSVLLESANFDATTIRRTAARHKKRTEASMRFEKNLDPNHNVDALKRFLFLLDRAGVSYNRAGSLISLGKLAEQKNIIIEHAFIEARLGVAISSERVVSVLEKLCFGVALSHDTDNLVYTVAVPSFRATKDIKIAEDIVEEVGRSIGYDSLPRIMPAMPLRPSDLHKVYASRSLKRFLSYGLQMRELYGYSFFDETVLKELSWQPTDFVAIKNPISENYTRLVTTLQPHLLKAVADNNIHHSQLRFYECGRVWHLQGEEIIEKKSISGIFFDQSSAIDFYAGKALMERMFGVLNMNVIWQSNNGHVFPWLSLHQTATLMHDGNVIGTAGMVEQTAVNALSPAGGSAFIFECDADYLFNYKRPVEQFEPLSKYPSVRRDVSMLITESITTQELINSIELVDPRIDHVTLIDFFTKPEWENQKAMTFHVEMRDKAKTLDSHEVDDIWSRVITQLQQRGAVIR